MKGMEITAEDLKFFTADETGEHLVFSIPVGHIEKIEETVSGPEVSTSPLYLSGTVTFEGKLSKKASKKFIRFIRRQKLKSRMMEAKDRIKKIFKKGK